VNNQNVPVPGKPARLNSSQFPYMIYDAQNTQLLVDSRGNIVNRSPRQVGVLKNYTG
jgi:hypothetical protein